MGDAKGAESFSGEFGRFEGEVDLLTGECLLAGAGMGSVWPRVGEAARMVGLARVGEEGAKEAAAAAGLAAVSLPVALALRKLAKLRPAPLVSFVGLMPGRATRLCRRLSSIMSASGGADLPSPASLPSRGPAALPPMKLASETGEPPEPALAVPVGPAWPPYLDSKAAPRREGAGESCDIVSICKPPDEVGREPLWGATRTNEQVSRVG